MGPLDRFCHRLRGGNWFDQLDPFGSSCWQSLGPTKAPETLLTSGLFAVMRHPGDTCIFLFGIAWGFYIGSWLILVAMVPWAIAVHFLCHRREERFFRSQFHEQYSAYEKRVKRYGILTPLKKQIYSLFAAAFLVLVHQLLLHQAADHFLISLITNMQWQLSVMFLLVALVGLPYGKALQARS